MRDAYGTRRHLLVACSCMLHTRVAESSLQDQLFGEWKDHQKFANRRTLYAEYGLESIVAVGRYGRAVEKAS